jgi:hypothetical protein
MEARNMTRRKPISINEFIVQEQQVCNSTGIVEEAAKKDAEIQTLHETQMSKVIFQLQQASQCCKASTPVTKPCAGSRREMCFGGYIRWSYGIVCMGVLRINCRW